LPHPLPDNLKLIPHEQTDSGWLEQTLAEAGQVWVTEDSVSMLYEALTAGGGVGLLRLPDPRDSRVGRGVQELVADGWVMPFEAWKNGKPINHLPVEFNEANRVSDLMLKRFGAS
jgi:mitochondrial fission protein ELM1